MADNPKVLVNVGLDTTKLRKELEKFGRVFKAELRKELAKTDLSKDVRKALGLNTPFTLKFNLAGTKREFDRVKNALKVTLPLKLNLADARKQIQDFQNSLNPIQLPVIVGTKAPATTPTQKQFSGATPFQDPSLFINNQKLKALTQSLDEYKNKLKESGATEKEVAKATREYVSQITSLERVLSKIRLDQERFARKTAGLQGPSVGGAPLALTSWIPNPSQVRALELAGIKSEKLQDVLNKLNPAQARLGIETARVTDFMESFGFKVGILGFGLGILGGHFQRASEFMIQFAQDAAKAVEPLERIRNLLTQDPSIGADERSGILGELNRLADLPGSNLEQTAKTFRSLRTLGLETVATLQLLEGLTKATGRSGIGAEGLDRIAAQLRDFASTGQLRQQEIRSIISAGGKDISDIFTNRFGGTTGEAINKIAPSEFFKILIADLQALPTPLETTTDKFNRLTNVLNRLKLQVLDILKPGLDNLVATIQKLEPYVTKLTDAFNNLSEGKKSAIGNLLTALPLVLGGLATLLTALAAVGIAAATLNHSVGALSILRTGLAKWAGAAGVELGVLAAVGLKLKNVFSGLMPIFRLFRLQVNQAFTAAGSVGMAGGLTGFFTTLTKGLAGAGSNAMLLSLTKFAGILAKIVGLTTPVGLLLNTLLAYFTNSGFARNIINGALSKLFDSLVKLGQKISEFFSGPAGKAVLDFINSLINLLGGTLADVVAAIILQLADLVDIVSTVFDLLTSPSLKNLDNFAKAVVNAFTNPFIALGKLLAASFLDALAENIPGNGKPPTLGQTVIGGGWSLLGGTGIKERFNETANSLRQQVLGNFGAGANTGGTQFTQQIVTINDLLGKAARAAREFVQDFDKVRDTFGQASVQLLENQIKFQESLRRTSIETEFKRLIKADPVAARAGLDSMLEGQRQTALAGQARIDAAKRKDIANRASQYLTWLDSTQMALKQAPNVLAYVNIVKNTFKDINKMVAEGHTSWAAYNKMMVALVGNVKALENQIASSPGMFIGEAGQAQLEDIKKNLSEMATFADEYAKAQTESLARTQEINNDIIQRKQQYLDEIELLDKQIAAERAAVYIRKDIAKIDEQIALKQEAMTVAKELGLLNEIELNYDIHQLTDKRNELEEKLGDTLRVEADVLEEIQTRNERNLKDEEAKAAAALRYLQILRQTVAESEAAFKQGIQLANDFASAVRSARTESGIQPFVTVNESLLQALFRSSLGIDVDSIGAEITNIKQIFKTFTGLTNDIFKNKILEDLLTESLNPNGDFENRFAILLKNTLESSIKLAARGDELKQELVAAMLGGKDTAAIIQDQTLLAKEQRALARVMEVLNKIFNIRNKVLDDNNRLQQKNLNITRAKLEFERESLEIEKQLAELRQRQRQLNSENGGSLRDALRAQPIEREDAIKREIADIKNKYQLLLAELDLRMLNLEAQMRLAGATEDEITAMRSVFEERKKLLGELENLETEEAKRKLPEFTQKILDLAEAFKEVYGAARDARNAISDLFNQIVNGEFVLDAFQKLLDGTGSSAKLFGEMAKFAIAAVGQAIADTIIQLATEGGKFLEVFGKILGDILIKIGTALIQMSVMAPVMAFMHGLAQGGLFKGLADAAATLPWAALGTAIGLGMIALGQAMGGGAASKTSNTNTANAANASTGATGSGFDPDRDPRTVYQKALMAQIQIDIRTDDTQIVKTMIKHVNQNGRLTRLIGNRKLQFGY